MQTCHQDPRAGLSAVEGVTSSVHLAFTASAPRGVPLCLLLSLALDKAATAPFFVCVLHPWHVDVPGPGVQPVPQKPRKLLQ